MWFCVCYWKEVVSNKHKIYNSSNNASNFQSSRSKIAHLGYSAAQCTGNSPAYLDANRISMQEPIGGRSVLAFFGSLAC